MGLDMTFYKINKTLWKKADGEWTDELYENSKEVGYFRKANQIQNWLLKNMKDYKDNYIGRIRKKEIKSLLKIIKKVLNDKKLAPKLLPTTSGFFFGSTEYDEWYFRQLEEAIEIFENILNEYNKNTVIFYSESY